MVSRCSTTSVLSAFGTEMTVGGKLTILYAGLFLILGITDMVIPDRFVSLHVGLSFIWYTMMFPFGLIGHILFSSSSYNHPSAALFWTLSFMVPNFFLWGYTTAAIIDAIVIPKGPTTGEAEQSDSGKLADAVSIRNILKK